MPRRANKSKKSSLPISIGRSEWKIASGGILLPTIKNSKPLANVDFVLTQDGLPGASVSLTDRTSKERFRVYWNTLLSEARLAFLEQLNAVRATLQTTEFDTLVTLFSKLFTDKPDPSLLAIHEGTVLSARSGKVWNQNVEFCSQTFTGVANTRAEVSRNVLVRILSWIKVCLNSLELQPFISNTAAMDDTISSFPSTSMSTFNTTASADHKKKSYDMFAEATSRAETSITEAFSVLSGNAGHLFSAVQNGASSSAVIRTDLVKPLLERYGAEVCAGVLQKLSSEVRKCLTVSETYMQALENLLEDACQPEDEGGLTPEEVLVVYKTLLKAVENVEIIRAQEEGVRSVWNFVNELEEPETGLACSDQPKTFLEAENLALKLRKTVEEYAAVKTREATQERLCRWGNLLTSRNVLLNGDGIKKPENAETLLNEAAMDASLLSEDEMEL